MGAVAATTVSLFVSSHAMAQDDLEALLGDLEKETATTASQKSVDTSAANQQVEAQAVVKEEQQAESKVEQEPVEAAKEETVATPVVQAAEESPAVPEPVQAAEESAAKEVAATVEAPKKEVDQETLNLLSALKDEVAALPAAESKKQDAPKDAKAAPAVVATPKTPDVEIAEGPNKEFLENIFALEIFEIFNTWVEFCFTV
jgi:hypothetical protein